MRSRFCTVNTLRNRNTTSTCFQAQYLPRHVGIPLGGADSPQYLMLESHYDNPHFHAGSNTPNIIVMICKPFHMFRWFFSLCTPHPTRPPPHTLLIMFLFGSVLRNISKSSRGVFVLSSTSQSSNGMLLYAAGLLISWTSTNCSTPETIYGVFQYKDRLSRNKIHILMTARNGRFTLLVTRHYTDVRW